MKCRTVQDKLSRRSELNPEMQEHLESCGDCRVFARDLEAFAALGASPVPTPAGLRERTLARCETILQEKAAARGMPAWRRLLRWSDSPRFVVAAAILGFIVLGGLIVYQIAVDRGENSDLSVELAVLQLVIQNLVTALFLPALLMLKKGIGGRRVF